VRSEKKSISIVKTLKRNNRTATPKIIEITFYTIIRFFLNVLIADNFQNLK